ncbi:MAG: LLM class flavin-dependent oxidoreductase [Thaumarchaeota archaeon]|nr:LLM class flavin-dependent oxidoreductase [Nitrososphaerota archaeon]
MVKSKGSRAKSTPGKATLKFSIGLGGPLAPLLQRALRAEELGFDFLWVPDHLTDILPATSIYDAWTVLAYIGARTERVMLGSGVTDIQRMHPAKTASTVVSLDNLTGGRAILGIGAGEVMNTAPYGIEWEPTKTRLSRLREYIEVVQLLWSSSYDRQVGYDGKFYNFKEAHLGLPPFREPRPPVYIGAFSSNSMLEIAGELADGWYPGAYFSRREFKEKVRIIHDATSRAGRKPGSVDLMANVPVVFGDDNETMSIVRSEFKRSLVINRYMLKLLGEEAAYEVVSKTLLYQLIAPTPAYGKLLDKMVRELPVSDEALDEGIAEMMAVGTTAEIVEKLARFTKAGATHIHVSSFANTDETLETFAKKVMPVLRAEG